MKENEAIAQLRNEYLVASDTASARYHNEALDTAIAALEEVQEYHATGRTPDMVRGLIGGYNRVRKQCVELGKMLKEYEDIGNLEICREAVERTRWIPVREQLPEKEDEINYLVTIRGYGVDIANYIKSAKVWVSLGIPCEVIAWKPLPEPYHITNPGKKVGDSE